MSIAVFKTDQRSERLASVGVSALVISPKSSAEVIQLFRNVLPDVSGYFDSVMMSFRAADETDFNFQKMAAAFHKAGFAAREINFLKFSHTLLQTPEGFKGQYIPYLNWINTVVFAYLNGVQEVLSDYYKDLAIFISSQDARKSLKDVSFKTEKMQQNLDDLRQTLNDFFDSTTSAALRPARQLFDRAVDITASIELTESINKKRLLLKNKQIMSLTTQISELLGLLTDSTNKDKIPDVSKQAAAQIAAGAMVAAHYVEMYAIMRYRIEEVISAVGIMAEQIVKASEAH